MKLTVDESSFKNKIQLTNQPNESNVNLQMAAKFVWTYDGWDAGLAEPCRVVRGGRRGAGRLQMGRQQGAEDTVRGTSSFPSDCFRNSSGCFLIIFRLRVSASPPRPFHESSSCHPHFPSFFVFFSKFSFLWSFPLRCHCGCWRAFLHMLHT